MTLFAQNLATLESVENYARMELYGAGAEPVAVIENAPHSKGSLQIYYHVSLKWGGVGPAAAKRALELFAEHTDDAKRHPGKHPNIDRLFEIIEKDEYYSVRCYPKS